MNHENWIVGSHRTVDRLLNDRQVAISEVFSGAADSVEQADEFQRLIAAAPDMHGALLAFIEAIDDPIKRYV